MKRSKLIAVMMIMVIVLVILWKFRAGAYTFSQTRKESPQDFNKFLEACTIAERVQMLQALKDLPKLKDKYFGKLRGLPALSNFTTDKDKATPSKPLKPSTFNEVLPETVIDAMREGIIDREDLSPSAVRKALVWRAYNKTTYLFRGDKEVDYHGIVQWVAEKSDVDKQQVKNLPTYALENKIAEKYFQALWDKMTPEQRMAVLNNLEKETGITVDKNAVVTMSGAAAIIALSTMFYSGNSLLVAIAILTGAEWIPAILGVFGINLTLGKAGIGMAILYGPIGLTIAAGLAGASVYFMGSAEKETVSAFIMTVGMIKAKKYAH